MSNNEKRIYEGMFLFPHSSLSNMQEASDHIHSLLERVEAEVVSFKKWDDRRLAYEIDGNKRGVYFLCYFNCDPTQIEVLERFCNQSESLLRFLVTRADHINPEEIEAADGRESLADEIKLREEESAAGGEGGDTSSFVTVGGKSDAAEETEEAPAEEPASEEAEEKEATEAPAGSEDDKDEAAAETTAEA